MHEETSPARVPSAIQITVRWGASVLMAKRISPPKSMALTGGVGRLELGANGLELVAGRERLTVVRGKRTRTVVDDVEIVIDATEDKLPFVAFPPVLERRYAAADAGALLFHAGIFGVAFLTYAPLSHAETDEDALRRALDRSEVRSIPLAVESSFNDEVGPPVTLQPRPVPKAEPTRSGPRTSAPAPASEPTSIDEARSFGMIGLLASADRDAASLWADARFPGDAFGEPSHWGTSRSDGSSGGLALSGTGEWGGPGGSSVTLGTLSTVQEGAQDALDRGLGEHRVKAPRFCGSERCGARVEGRLPPEVVQRIVRQNHGRFRQCFVDTQRGASSDVRVSVKFVIGRDGSVGSAAATSDRHDGLASCVARAFYGLSFPQPEGGVVSVSYPLVFTSDG